MIKNIVFDIGGVLCHLTFEEKLDSHGFNPDERERVKAATYRGPYWIDLDVGIDTKETITSNMVSLDKEVEYGIRAFMSNISGVIRKEDYADEWIVDLKNRGYRVYFLSNWSLPLIREAWEKMDFLALCDGGILSYREHVVKPDPAIYNLLLDRYGLVAEECLFVDDLAENVEGAKRCGLNGVVFTQRSDVENVLKTEGL